MSFLRKTVIALVVWGVCGVAGQAQAQSPAQNAAAPTSATRQTKATRKTPTTPVNINTATTTELQTLPGIGPATAARILEYRQKNGGFKKIEDLMNIRGIGEKSFLKLKPLVTIATPKSGG